MKKKLSILSLLFGLFVCVTVFCSCSKDDDNGSSASNPLVGTWRAEVEEKGEQQYWDITFNSDFTLSTMEYNKEDNKVHSSESGTYRYLDETTIILTRSDGKEVTRRFKITDGNKLEFLDFDHGIIYYKIK
jgi:hypothetical protein